AGTIGCIQGAVCVGNITPCAYPFVNGYRGKCSTICKVCQYKKIPYRMVGGKIVRAVRLYDRSGTVLVKPKTDLRVTIIGGPVTGKIQGCAYYYSSPVGHMVFSFGCA